MTDAQNNAPEESAYERALRLVARNEDGGFDEKVFLELLASLMTVDLETEKWNKAKRLLQSHSTPGKTEADGQLSLPGLGTYAYEPERLIRDDTGHAIEQRAALPDYKAAEAARAERNADNAQRWARRKTLEARQHAQWALEELAAGRRQYKDAVFGTWVHDADIWSPGDAEPEEGPEETS